MTLRYLVEAFMGPYFGTWNECVHLASILPLITAVKIITVERNVSVDWHIRCVRVYNCDLLGIWL